MQALLSLGLLCALIGVCMSSSLQYNDRAFEDALRKRQDPGNSAAKDSLVVDLGYEVYQGVSNASTGLNNWIGIRYAAPPEGQLRWQPPQVPSTDRGQIRKADTLPFACPQSPDAPAPPTFNFTGSEDCLYLSVYAPKNKAGLPVLVWIHGGGYGLGSGNQDPTSLINANNDSFISVIIQYRLGAFGFLSSDEVMRYGAVNAGLLDQTFALQWIQSYIHLFGGDASKVTISGESAGAGAVMLQTMAFGGYLGTSLFSNAIAASPYLPMQYDYNAFVPSQAYYAFASAAGCFDPPTRAVNYRNGSIFQCLISKDTATLQNASAAISSSSRYGTWVFLPVTDGFFIQELPSQQLLKKKVNGKRLLVSNNANEGVNFTPDDIETEEDFINIVKDEFPLFSDDEISKVLYYYPSTNASVDTHNPDFATTGNMPPTAVNQSTFATGQQQRAENLYAETTFVCPSYWMSEAFSKVNHVSYRYQYSVIGGAHASDVTAYFGPPTLNQSPEFVKAIQTIWGNFITKNDPSIPDSIASGTKSSVSTPSSLTFPEFSIGQPLQVNLNQTGGVPYQALPFLGATKNITQFKEPGLKNSFEIVNAYTWEGGRGTRCDFWRSVASAVPE